MFKACFLSLSIGCLSCLGLAGCGGGERDDEITDHREEAHAYARAEPAYSDDGVYDTVEQANLFNARTGAVVGRGTLLNAEANFGGPGNGAAPMAFVGDQCFPLIQVGGKYYLAQPTSQGLVAGQPWNGQVNWVSPIRTLEDARLGVRTSDFAARKALERQRQIYRDQHNNRKEQFNEAKSWLNEGYKLYKQFKR